VIVFAIGYFIYARSINRNVMQPNENKATPAKMYMDGVGFSPANRNFLFGAANQMMASLALLLLTLRLKNTGRNYRWTFVPFIFIFLTTIGALAYNAYTAFVLNLPNAAALSTKQHITVGQVTIANVIIGVVAVVLILTALVVAWDGLRTFRQPEAVQPIRVSTSAD